MERLKITAGWRPTWHVSHIEFAFWPHIHNADIFPPKVAKLAAVRRHTTISPWQYSHSCCIQVHPFALQLAQQYEVG